MKKPRTAREIETEAAADRRSRTRGARLPGGEAMAMLARRGFRPSEARLTYRSRVIWKKKQPSGFRNSLAIMLSASFCAGLSGRRKDSPPRKPRNTSSGLSRRRVQSPLSAWAWPSGYLEAAIGWSGPQRALVERSSGTWRVSSSTASDST